MPGVRAGAREWAGRLGRGLRRSLGRGACSTLYLHTHGVWAWPHPTRGQAAPAPQAHENIDAWCAAHEGSDADVVVSGHLVHSLLVDTAVPLADEHALQTYVRQQFTHYHGAVAQDWPLAHWSEGPQRGACALHALDLAAVQRLCASHDVHLRSVRPAWSVVLQGASQASPLAAHARTALAVVDGALVTWLRVEAGQLRALQQRFAASATAPDIAALLAQLAAEAAAESTPLSHPPLIVGWGVAVADPGIAWPGRLLGIEEGPAPAARWLMAGGRRPTA